MLNYRVVKLSECIEGIRALVGLHWNEVGSKSPRRTLDPDFDTFFNLEKAGILIIVGVYEGDILVGYAANILTRDTHSKDFLVSYNDALFLHPNYRDGRAGLRLISKMEQVSKDRGAMAVTWHAKPDTPLMHLLSKKDYSIKDVVFMREV